MAATALTILEPPGKYPTSIAANAADFSFTASETATDANGTDGVTDGSNTFVSAGATFVDAMLGQIIIITGIRHVVVARNSATSLVFDGSPIASGTGLTWSIPKGNSYTNTGRELLIVRNVHATLARTISVISVPDTFNRRGHIHNYSLAGGAPGDWSALGPFPRKGWADSAGKTRLFGQNADIELAVFRLPAVM